jgi:hypothetical protein
MGFFEYECTVCIVSYVLRRGRWRSFLRVPGDREPPELERGPFTRAIANSLGGLAYPTGFAHPACELQVYSVDGSELL